MSGDTHTHDTHAIHFNSKQKHVIWCLFKISGRQAWASHGCGGCRPVKCDPPLLIDLHWLPIAAPDPLQDPRPGVPCSERNSPLLPSRRWSPSTHPHSPYALPPPGRLKATPLRAPGGSSGPMQTVLGPCPPVVEWASGRCQDGRKPARSNCTLCKLVNILLKNALTSFPSHTQVQYLIMHFCFVLHYGTTPSYVLFCTCLPLKLVILLTAE